eukprot:1161402-Pelagomonas_calceolata.AAC.5
MARLPDMGWGQGEADGHCKAQRGLPYILTYTRSQSTLRSCHLRLYVLGGIPLAFMRQHILKQQS